MKKITRQSLEKLNIDYYSLKEDVYGYWRDIKDIPQGHRSKKDQRDLEDSHELYSLLIQTTCTWTSSFDHTFFELLDLFTEHKPTQAKRVKRILRELLEAYEEVANNA